MTVTLASSCRKSQQIRNVCKVGTEVIRGIVKKSYIHVLKIFSNLCFILLYLLVIYFTLKGFKMSSNHQTKEQPDTVSLPINAIESLKELVELKSQHIEQEIKKKFWHQPSLWAALSAVLISSITGVMSYKQYDADNTLKKAETNVDYYEKRVALDTARKQLSIAEENYAELSKAVKKKSQELHAEEARLLSLKVLVSSHRDDELTKLNKEIEDLSKDLSDKRQLVNEYINQVLLLKTDKLNLSNQLKSADAGEDTEQLQNDISARDESIAQLELTLKELKRQLEFNAIYAEVELKRSVTMSFILPNSSINVRLDNVTSFRNDVDFSYGLNRELSYKVNGLSIGDSISKELEGVLYVFSVIQANTKGGESATLKIIRVIKTTSVN